MDRTYGYTRQKNYKFDEDTGKDAGTNTGKL